MELEIFNNLLAGVAERMGHTLRRTAMSVNVKERLDYSCAVFTAAGELAASAAHIPVHLGAMGATVRAVVADNPDMRPGDAFATNDPYRGGFSTGHYGRPSSGWHAIQVEVNRALYVDEETLRPRTGDFERTRALLLELVERLGRLQL